MLVLKYFFLFCKPHRLFFMLLFSLSFFLLPNIYLRKKIYWHKRLFPQAACNTVFFPLHERISKHWLRISAVGLLFSKAVGRCYNAGSTSRLQCREHFTSPSSTKSHPVFVIHTIVEVLTKIEDYLPLTGQCMFAAESHMYNSLGK